MRQPNSRSTTRTPAATWTCRPCRKAIRQRAFLRDETALALIVNADDSPPNIHLVDLVEGTSRQLTQALNPEIDPSHLVRGEVVRYPSFDGLEIPSILYRPHGATAERPVPAMVWVHGGPGGQSRTGYSAMFQHLVNHGFAVLAANNRGSSGYGKTFYHLDDRRHGEEDLGDIVHARTYLASLDWIDDTRVGVIGGSYGGFMVAAALAFHPQAFDVGIDIFGVTNWVRTLQSIPPWWANRSEKRCTMRWETQRPTPNVIDAFRRCFMHIKSKDPCSSCRAPTIRAFCRWRANELVAAVRTNGVPVRISGVSR